MAVDSCAVFTDGWWQKDPPADTNVESVVLFSFGWFEGTGIIIAVRIPRPPVMIGNPYIM